MKRSVSSSCRPPVPPPRRARALEMGRRGPIGPIRLPRSPPTHITFLVDYSVQTVFSAFLQLADKYTDAACAIRRKCNDRHDKTHSVGPGLPRPGLAGWMLLLAGQSAGHLPRGP